MKSYKTGRDPYDIYKELMQAVRFGHLVVPEDITELPDEILDGHNTFWIQDKMIKKEQFVSRITSIEVPGTVKRIGRRAFAECVNLRQVTLSEGVEEIARRAFINCNKLKTIRLPASIRKVDGDAFLYSGLEEPVFSHDKKRLIYYPPSCPASGYAVPEGVEEISSAAFSCNKALKQISLPISLKRIQTRAFIDCGFTEIRIPAGVWMAGHAFDFTRSKLTIQLADQLQEPEKRRELLRITGKPFLSVVRPQLPDDEYWKKEPFCAMAKRCAGRSVPDMDQMGDYFASKSAEYPETEFYRCAEHLWRTRAWMYGSEAGRKYLKKRVEENPDEPIESPFITEGLRASVSGRKLNALGFLYFEEDREYTLSGMDAQGVVEASAYSGEDGPDESGFGREIEYDWWYLDDCLNLPEGLGYFHGFSDLDKRNNKKRFDQLHDSVAAAACNPWARAGE